MPIRGGDKAVKVLAQIGASIGNKSVDVGFMEGATYPDGTSVAMVAYWNEFGRKNQPPRPFFRKMIAAQEKKWAREIAALLKATNYDGEKTLALMGEEISADLVDSIRETNSPALSPVTLMLRKMFWTNRNQITGRDIAEAARRVRAGEQGATGTQAKPLIWTGDMMRAVTYKVKV